MYHVLLSLDVLYRKVPNLFSLSNVYLKCKTWLGFKKKNKKDLIILIALPFFQVTLKRRQATYKQSA